MSRKTIAAVSVLAAAAVVGLAIAFSQNSEPVYNSEPVSYWAVRLANKPDAAAREAITHIGFNAVPSLVQMLGRRDWPYREEVVSWVSSHKSLQSVIRFGPSAETVRGGALIALNCLGTNARPALPVVLPLLTNKSLNIRIHAVFVLTATAPDTDSVKWAVPVLINDLTDPEWTMRLAAVYGLNALTPLPPEADAALIGRLNDPMEGVRDGELDCLVARTNAKAIAVLDHQLSDADSFVVTKAATRIGVFGDAAKASVPRLEELRTNTILSVREAATNALIAITGKEVASHGPQPSADIMFNFPGIAVEALIGVYEGWAREKVQPPQTGWPAEMVRAITPYLLTTPEALQLIEDALRQQAHIIIRHFSDGSLVAELDTPPDNAELNTNSTPSPARRPMILPRPGGAPTPFTRPSPQ